MRLLTTFAALILAFAGLSIATAPAMAQTATDSYSSGYNAARTEAMTRPCFGVLLDYQLRTCHVRPKRYYGANPYSGRTHLTINCDTARQAYVEDMIGKMRSGGTVRLVARNRSCVASLLITKSLKIVGDNGGSRLPVLVAPDGESCLRINPTASKVTLQDMLIVSKRGGQSACIYSSGTELTLQNSTVRYEGETAAVHVSGGRLNLLGSFVVAKTRTVAVAVNSAVLNADQVGITSTANGLYAVLNGDSRMQGVSVQQLADWRGFERGKGAIGMEVRLDSGDAILSMDDMRVEFFADALSLSGGGEALLSRSLIDYSDHGVISRLNRLRLIDNKILSEEIAIDIDEGTGFVGGNEIARVRTAGILASSRGEVRAVDNKIDPAGEGCPTLQWGNLEPSQRTCTPWYKGSEFDTPSDATRQYLFADYWPRLSSESN